MATSKFSFDPSAVSGSTGNLERDLTHLFVELGETAREHDTGVVFLIDEMQFLEREELEAIAAAMHRMSQKQLPVALAGTGLPQLPGLMVDAKSYAERLFSYPGIGPLSGQAARQALVDPANAEGASYDDDALERIVELSGGYATFVQAYGKETWNMAPGSADHARRRAGCRADRAGEARRGVLPCPLREGDPAERRYMAAMADLGDGPQRTGDVAKRLGSGVSSISVHRDALIKKGLIFSPDHGEVDFTVPHFSSFMRRRYPLEAPKTSASKAGHTRVT